MFLVQAPVYGKPHNRYKITLLTMSGGREAKRGDVLKLWVDLISQMSPRCMSCFCGPDSCDPDHDRMWSSRSDCITMTVFCAYLHHVITCVFPYLDNIWIQIANDSLFDVSPSLYNHCTLGCSSKTSAISVGLRLLPHTHCTNALLIPILTLSSHSNIKDPITGPCSNAFVQLHK